jgi:hypothetical protein
MGNAIDLSSTGAPSEGACGSVVFFFNSGL